MCIHVYKCNFTYLHISRVSSSRACDITTVALSKHADKETVTPDILATIGYLAISHPENQDRFCKVNACEILNNILSSCEGEHIGTYSYVY
jgi:hypothetical protein